MNDLIYRLSAIEAALSFVVEYCGAAFDEDMQMELKQRLEELPPVQPDLYGYSIEHLALIATVMQKEGVPAEKAIQDFGNTQDGCRLLFEEIKNNPNKATESYFCEKGETDGSD